MRTTIDAAGRVVIPKAIREELDLVGGREIEIELFDGTIEISIPPTPMRIEGEGRDVYAVSDRPLPPLSEDVVRRTLERTRR